MTVIQNPILRRTPNNDEERYRGFAMTQMNILTEYMKLAGLNTYQRIVRLSNGVIIHCKQSYNTKNMFVYVPSVGTYIEEPTKITTLLSGFYYCKASTETHPYAYNFKMWNLDIFADPESWSFYSYYQYNNTYETKTPTSWNFSGTFDFTSENAILAGGIQGIPDQNISIRTIDGMYGMTFKVSGAVESQGTYPDILSPDKYILTSNGFYSGLVFDYSATQGDKTLSDVAKHMSEITPYGMYLVARKTYLEPSKSDTNTISVKETFKDDVLFGDTTWIGPSINERIPVLSHKGNGYGRYTVNDGELTDFECWGKYIYANGNICAECPPNRKVVGVGVHKYDFINEDGAEVYIRYVVMACVDLTGVSYSFWNRRNTGGTLEFYHNQVNDDWFSSYNMLSSWIKSDNTFTMATLCNGEYGTSFMRMSPVLFSELGTKAVISNAGSAISYPFFSLSMSLDQYGVGVLTVTKQLFALSNYVDNYRPTPNKSFTWHNTYVDDAYYIQNGNGYDFNGTYQKVAGSHGSGSGDFASPTRATRIIGLDFIGEDLQVLEIYVEQSGLLSSYMETSFSQLVYLPPYPRIADINDNKGSVVGQIDPHGHASGSRTATCGFLLNGVELSTDFISTRNVSFSYYADFAQYYMAGTSYVHDPFTSSYFTNTSFTYLDDSTIHKLTAFDLRQKIFLIHTQHNKHENTSQQSLDNAYHSYFQCPRNVNAGKYEFKIYDGVNNRTYDLASLTPYPVEKNIARPCFDPFPSQQHTGYIYAAGNEVMSPETISAISAFNFDLPSFRKGSLVIGRTSGNFCGSHEKIKFVCVDGTMLVSWGDFVSPTPIREYHEISNFAGNTYEATTEEYFYYRPDTNTTIPDGSITRYFGLI